MLRRTSFSTSSPERDWLSSRMRKVEPNGTVSASVTSLLKGHAEQAEQKDEAHRHPERYAEDTINQKCEAARPSDAPLCTSRPGNHGPVKT